MRADDRSVELRFALGDMTIAALVTVRLRPTGVVFPGCEVDVVMAGAACHIMRARVKLVGLWGLLMACRAFANVPWERGARKVFHRAVVAGELIFSAGFHAWKVWPVVDLVNHHGH